MWIIHMFRNPYEHDFTTFNHYTDSVPPKAAPFEPWPLVPSGEYNNNILWTREPPKFLHLTFGINHPHNAARLFQTRQRRTIADRHSQRQLSFLSFFADYLRSKHCSIGTDKIHTPYVLYEFIRTFQAIALLHSMIGYYHHPVVRLSVYLSVCL